MEIGGFSKRSCDLLFLYKIVEQTFQLHLSGQRANGLLRATRPGYETVKGGQPRHEKGPGKDRGWADPLVSCSIVT